MKVLEYGVDSHIIYATAPGAKGIKAHVKRIDEKGIIFAVVESGKRAGRQVAISPLHVRQVVPARCD